MSQNTQHYCGIGGQAVLEGVMMKNGDRYAVAVRKESGEIVTSFDTYRGILADTPLRKIPLARGFLVLLDSLILGLKVTDYSASLYEAEETEAEKEKSTDGQGKDDSGSGEGFMSAAILVISLILSVGLFIVLPYFIASFLSSRIGNPNLLAVLEGVIRVAIFIAYILAISAMKDIRRLFQYHGAEHKCINCIEAGLPLMVENARKSTRLHKRCGSSFTLFVMLVSIVLFFFIRVDSHALRVVLRILLIPVISGISYEIIRLSGTSSNPIIQIIAKPGLWMQYLTRREPDDEMIEVGIASVNAIYDWKSYQKEEFGAAYDAA